MSNDKERQDLPLAEELTPEEALARDLWQQHGIIAQRLHRMVQQQVKSHTGEPVIARLPGRQRDLMMNVRFLCIKSPEGVPLKVLAHELAITPPTVSVMVEGLVEQGLLTRTTAPRDRRVKLIRLSPWSERLFTFGDKIVGQELGRHLAGFEQDILREMLQKMVQITDRMEEEEGRVI